MIIISDKYHKLPKKLKVLTFCLILIQMVINFVSIKKENKIIKTSPIKKK